jgi:hypothetical protein
MSAIAMMSTMASARTSMMTAARTHSEVPGVTTPVPMSMIAPLPARGAKHTPSLPATRERSAAI